MKPDLLVLTIEKTDLDNNNSYSPLGITPNMTRQQLNTVQASLVTLCSAIPQRERRVYQTCTSFLRKVGLRTTCPDFQVCKHPMHRAGRARRLRIRYQSTSG